MKTNFRHKTKAFSLFEVIISILIMLILIQLASIKYQDVVDKRDIKLAKQTITDMFFLTSKMSAKYRKNYELTIDRAKKILEIKDGNKTIKVSKLPQKLSYIPSEFFLHEINKTITSTGNIRKSFSIYICDRRGRAKHRISLYGFSSNQFLRINNYKRIGTRKLTKDNILNYKDLYNLNRDEFNKDWLLE